jgi:cytoskeletal protein RodZ
MTNLTREFEHLTPGKLLRNRRTEAGISLEEASQSTKIRIDYLKALEADEYSKFDAKVYIKGFLKMYASFLDISAERILALYRRHVGEEEKDEELTFFNSNISVPRFVITPKIIGFITVALVVLSVVGYLVFQFQSYQQPPSLEIIQPENLDITTQEKELYVEGSTDVGTNIFINSESVTVDEEGSFKTVVNLKEGENIIIVRAAHIDNIGKENEKKIHAVYETEQVAQENNNTENNQPEPEEKTEFEAQVRITNSESWIEIMADNQTEYKQVLQPGFDETFTFKNEFVLTTGRLTSTTVLLEGEEVDLTRTVSGVAGISCKVESGELECE